MSKSTLNSQDHAPTSSAMASKVLLALGIVYGDIGTSPLYALRECFHGSNALPLSANNVYGILSLIVWSLLLVITAKYTLLLLQADNKGEGGMLALMSLASNRRTNSNSKNKNWNYVTILGLVGAALIYGDGAVTPAISVLSAIEGLAIATPFFEPYVVAISTVLIVLLFVMQSRGSTKIGKAFGPIILLWFVVIGLLGLRGIIQDPSILKAIDPRYAIAFFRENAWYGFVALGSVFLVVTGGEALYADLGHFGKKSIRLGWFVVVLPCLLLQYFGQGALLLTQPHAASNPFYFLAPSWVLLPLVALASTAAIIASQAMLTGAFSISAQAVQLGYLPRIEIQHTSANERGQIYVPLVNWLLLAGCLFLVFEFQTSSRLAAAYGIAVTGAMLITSILTYIVLRRRWKWSRWIALPIMLVFGAIDLSFLSANMLKFWDGGWFPIMLAIIVFVAMTTWKSGRSFLSKRLGEISIPLDKYLKESVPLIKNRKSGIAVFMTANPKGTPSALVQNVKHNAVLHETVLIMSVVTEKTPHVSDSERITLTNEGQGFYKLIAHYGFMESPNVPEVIKKCASHGIVVDPENTTFFLGRETLIAASASDMAIWREKIFIFMSRNAQRATDYFKIPSKQAIEIGTVIEI